MILDYLKEALNRKLSGRDVEELLITPQEDYEEVEVLDIPVRGYLMSDGRWLSIGGQQDHRFINGMVQFDRRTEESFRTNETLKMLHIMRVANLIRYIPESDMFQILVKPTYNQIKELFKYCEREGKIEIEYGTNNPSKEYTKEYVDELEDDLKNYNGEV